MNAFRIFCLCLLLTACTTGGDSVSSQPNLTQFGKSTVDEVIELHQQRLMQDLKTLSLKLYRRNPNQRHDRHLRTVEDSVARLFIYPAQSGFVEWQQVEPTELIRASLQEDYQGDRVLAFTVGMRRMLMASYDNRTEFYYFSSVDAQKLYNSARNIEIAAWLLANQRDADGKRLILSDSMTQLEQNLSFQRLIGGMIATQDNLAEFIAQKERRVLKTVVIKATTMMFLPI